MFLLCQLGASAPLLFKNDPEDLKHEQDHSWDLPSLQSDPMHYCFVMLMKNPALKTNEWLRDTVRVQNKKKDKLINTMSGTKPNKAICLQMNQKYLSTLSYLSINYRHLVTKLILRVLGALKVSLYHLKQFMCKETWGWGCVCVYLHSVEDIQSYLVDCFPPSFFLLNR